MSLIKFSKMVASGNDFVVIEEDFLPSGLRLKDAVKKICSRKFGVGADGVLVIGKSCKADIRMRIFNADATEAEMCGNGARCAAFYAAGRLSPNRVWNEISIETIAGIIDSRVVEDSVKAKLTYPKELKLGIGLKVNGRNIKTDFINTGVPHAVLFVEGLEKINVFDLGRRIRQHKYFSPRGTNVNFVEVIGKNSIKVRTFERGVEDETLACGTGSVASALIFALKTGLTGEVKVHTRSLEVLSVYFRRQQDIFGDVWLEGKADIVFIGELEI